jgi:hypothetical protein
MIVCSFVLVSPRPPPTMMFTSSSSRFFNDRTIHHQQQHSVCSMDTEIRENKKRPTIPLCRRCWWLLLLAATNSDTNDADHEELDFSNDPNRIISYNDFEEFDTKSSLSWYDDFGDQPIGDGDDTDDDDNTTDTRVTERIVTSEDTMVRPSSPKGIPLVDTILSARIASLQRQEQRRSAVCDRNWKLGNWFVRGFSLDMISSSTTNTRNMNNQTTTTMPLRRQLPPSLNDTFSTTQSSTNEKDLSSPTTSTIPNVSVIAVATTPKSYRDMFETDTVDLPPSKNQPDGVDLWVGRTDGSVFGIRLGTDYWTRFYNNNNNDDHDWNVTTNIQNGGDWDAAAISNTKQDTDVDTIMAHYSDDDIWNKEEDDTMSAPPTDADVDPFMIVTQFQAGQLAISAITVVVPITDDDDSDSSNSCYIFTSTMGSTDIQRWYCDGHNVVSYNGTWTGAHTGTSILALKTIYMMNDESSDDVGVSCLLSIDDSSVALWNVMSGNLLGCVDSIQIPKEAHNVAPIAGDGLTIECVDTDGKNVYCGTSLGYVIVYSIDDILSSKTTLWQVPPPVVGYWRAATDDCAITAMQCGGLGTLGRNTKTTKSIVVYTGDANGILKQWEVLQIPIVNNEVDDTNAERISYKIEAWPKLSTQRLPKKAHLFVGHDDCVTAILSVDALKFVSASTDGTSTYKFIYAI